MLSHVTFVATLVSGLFSGMALQKLVVELPARKRIGAIHFATYARAADLGNGRYVYPAFAIVSELLTVAAFVMAAKLSPASRSATLLGLAAVAGFGVLVMTLFAAPQMLALGRAENKEEVLAFLLLRFVLYSWPRAVFIWLQFGLLLRVLQTGL